MTEKYPSLARCSDDGLQCTGLFDIHHGQGHLARFVARCLKLPPEARSVQTTLRIAADQGGECWERSFGGTILRSVQHCLPGDVVVERFKLIELRYLIERSENELRHRHVGTALRIGRVRIPLAKWMSPRIHGVEMRTDCPNRICVQVDVTAPLIGLVLAYRGVVEVGGGGP